MESFWRELVPNLYMAGYHNFCNDGTVSWLSDDQINAWIEIVIRIRPHGARFTVAKAGTTFKHPGSQQFVIVTDEHIKGTLDGTTRPYPSCDEVDWVSLNADKCRMGSLGFHFQTPQQANLSDYGVVTCFIVYNLSAGQEPIVVGGDTQRFFNNVRKEMVYQFYSCRCEDTTNLGYD
ncbi:hypothetical protein Tco_0023455 [Tanacetum coccineum]